MQSLLWLLVAISVVGAFALERTIGDPNDSSLQSVVSNCLTTTPNSGFTYDKCTFLVRCVLDNVVSEIAAGFQSGSNIASLVPTTLALIGIVHYTQVYPK